MKNELIKILKKKSVYIIFAITLCFIVLTNIVSRNTDNYSNLDDETISSYEENLSSYDVTNPEENEIYIHMKSKIDMFHLMQHYGLDSWQAYLIETELGSNSDIFTINEYELRTRKNSHGRGI